MSNSARRLTPATGLALLCVLLAAAPARAQVASTILGQVTDSAGAPVDGAAVRATNVATGTSRTAQTAAGGRYRIPDLLPGGYELRAELQGFKTFVRRNLVLTSQAALEVNVQLEVGNLTESVEVSAGLPLVETTESRITNVLDAGAIESLPAIGRSVLWLAMLTPGIQGKAEDSRQGYCCDSLQGNAAPKLSAGANEDKTVFMVDGVALHYGDGAGWGLAFTPNPDALEEVRVSTNPTSPVDGTMGGVQLQMVTKGGTNSYHGTAHYTFLEDSFNALPYGASKEDVGEWHQRFYGGTIGGPIFKDRLFFFGAFEGLREKRAASAGSTALVETQQFRDWVRTTRPNSIANSLLQAYPAAKNPTTGLRDINGDGIPDLGTIPLDRPAPRDGRQFNARLDYLSKSGRDRIYATYWNTDSNTYQASNARPPFDYNTGLPATLASLVNTHTFSPNLFNDVRVSRWTQEYDQYMVDRPFHVPCIQTDDGVELGPCAFGYEHQRVKAWDARDVVEWSRGSSHFRFGASFRHVYVEDPALLDGDVPRYNFTSLIAFADDLPYLETRNIDASTGQLRDPFVEYTNQQLGIFVQHEWQVKRGLTVNWGLRWDNFFNFPMTGLVRPTDLYQPLLTSDQITPAGIAQVKNRLAEDSFDVTLSNLSPRVSVAWDPWGRGRTVLRGGFFVLYDEVRSVGPYRDWYANPPRSSLLEAGAEAGIPIVYTGMAPVGTQDFPVNPYMVSSSIDEDLGIFVGTRPDIAGFPRDFETPRTYDLNAAVEHQLLEDLAVSLTYHYRHTGNEVLAFDANRKNGDLVDGRFDGVSPYYSAVKVYSNLGRRSYHGFLVTARKRHSRGWSATASYGHNAGYNNLTAVADVSNVDLDWARTEDAANVVKLYAVWDIPFFRRSEGLAGSILGGWQLSGAYNYECCFYFSPSYRNSRAAGGDFNADGRRDDRPDLPAGGVPQSYSQEQWLAGAIAASIFPKPLGVANGTLPRNYFTGPSYSRFDASLSKGFRIGRGAELRLLVQASNLLNKVNIRSVQSSLTASNFATATGFYPMRTIQLGVKLIF